MRTRLRLTAPLCALSQYSFAKNWGGAFEVLPAPWSRRTSEGRVEGGSTENLSVVGFSLPKAAVRSTGHLQYVCIYAGMYGEGSMTVISLLYIPACLLGKYLSVALRQIYHSHGTGPGHTVKWTCKMELTLTPPPASIDGMDRCGYTIL